MADQSQTLSLRISEALRKRLDQFREMMSARKGEAVTTSEVAKQLLESARLEETELWELLKQPTESLLQIRRKCEADHPLTRAEWHVLAYYVQQGHEAFFSNPVSSQSAAAILQAFQAVYKFIRKPSPQDGYYLGNLPRECWPEDEEPDAKGRAVNSAITETLRHLSDSDWSPGFIARNLIVCFDQEPIAPTVDLNHLLRPYWRDLWRVAARGHYFLQKKPLRGEVEKFDLLVEPPIPSLREAGYSLSFQRNEPGDLYLLLSWPGPRGTMYPVTDYAVISEFRAMLTALHPKPGTRPWRREHFFGYISEIEDQVSVWFRQVENGITFGFSPEEWNAVRKLFRRAWELPEVQAIWNELGMEYGEL